MDNVKIKYDEKRKQRFEVSKKILQLSQDKNVKKYLQLKEQQEKLIDEENILYKNMKLEEYESCNHIKIYTHQEYFAEEGRTYRTHGCIKCGLIDSVLSTERKFLTITGEAMYNYLNKNQSFKGIQLDVLCDLDLAQAIYSKIKKAHPNIDDETACKYFEIALDNIRNIKVSDERKISRAKRLSLNLYFNRWNAKDVDNF